MFGLTPPGPCDCGSKFWVLVSCADGCCESFWGCLDCPATRELVESS
jgi:hypothetical protein